MRYATVINIRHFLLILFPILGAPFFWCPAYIGACVLFIGIVGGHWAMVALDGVNNPLEYIDDYLEDHKTERLNFNDFRYKNAVKFIASFERYKALHHLPDDGKTGPYSRGSAMLKEIEEMDRIIAIETALWKDRVNGLRNNWILETYKKLDDE